MGRNQQRVVLFLIAFTHSFPVMAEPIPGQKPKNLKVVPPWTMRLCQVGTKLRVMRAVYDRAGALNLKKLDADCYTWKESASSLKLQVGLQNEIVAKQKRAIKSLEAQLKKEEQRTAQLTKDLKKEVAEKNKYKYKPTFGWVGWVVGGGAALIMTGVVIGLAASD